MDRVIELFTGMGPDIEACPALLQEAAESMRAIRREYPLDADDMRVLGPQIRRAQHKNLLAEELLNRAMAFYCEWLAAGSTSGGGYSPEIQNTVSSGKVLIMEA